MSDLFNRLQDEIDAQDQPGGLSPIDLLDLPSAISRIIKDMIRRNGMKLTEIAKSLEKSPQEAQRMLDELLQKGYLRQVKVKEEIWYKVRFAQKRNRTVSSSLWKALDEVVESDEDKNPTS